MNPHSPESKSGAVPRRDSVCTGSKKINHHLRTLGAEIIGELDQDAGLALFRGIPYASVAKRWTHSRTTHSLPSPFDATEFGPRCVQGDGPVLVSGGVTDPVPGDDEFKCLNLNITVPKESLPVVENSSSAGLLLPVMFWIHGGAFNYGANSVARYRPQILSSLAKKFGTPIVLVQIGYRLGPLGFVASEDLASENVHSLSTDYDHTGSVPLPPTGNYGFVDQRNALEWVRDHIRDFGGDPSNVTAFGISAGSASVHYHILTGAPLFDRAIMMSGSAPTLGPLPLELYEKEWQKLSSNSGIKEDDPEKRLEKLRALSPQQIIANYSKAAMGPMADGILLPSWNLGEQLPPSRCKSMIMGDTRVEAIMFDSVCKRLPQQQFYELVHSTFSAADANAFRYHFGFKCEPLPYEAYRDAMRLFLSATMFQIPNFGVAEASGPHTYLYHFEEPSPYPGPTFGVPYHGQCALFMYNNESNHYSAAAKRTAVELARSWTAFAHGREPWEPYSISQRFMRFGPGGEAVMKDVKNDEIRTYGYLDWCRNHWDDVKAFAQNLLNKL